MSSIPDSTVASSWAEWACGSPTLKSEHDARFPSARIKRADKGVGIGAHVLAVGDEKSSTPRAAATDSAGPAATSRRAASDPCTGLPRAGGSRIADFISSDFICLPLDLTRFGEGPRSSYLPPTRVAARRGRRRHRRPGSRPGKGAAIRVDIRCHPGTGLLLRRRPCAGTACFNNLSGES